MKKELKIAVSILVAGGLLFGLAAAPVMAQSGSSGEKVKESGRSWWSWIWAPKESKVETPAAPRAVETVKASPKSIETKAMPKPQAVPIKAGTNMPYPPPGLEKRAESVGGPTLKTGQGHSVTPLKEIMPEEMVAVGRVPETPGLSVEAVEGGGMPMVEKTEEVKAETVEAVNKVEAL